MENKQLTIEEKIEKIQSVAAFEEIQTRWFPQSAATSYYFVSYCHKDYKRVFIDVLDMQRCDEGLSVWYDREFNVGRDWEKEAKSHIYDFDCLGVIFYVSENSVQSPAVFREMQMAKAAGLPFIPIVLPIENIPGMEGEYKSGAALLDMLCPCAEEDEKHALYHEMFGDNILYFKSADSPQDKIERMKKAFTIQPLLMAEPCEAMSVENGATITTVNNGSVFEIKESDYRLFGADNQPFTVCEIGVSAFANCKHLETVLIPESVRRIDSYAFYNCKKLKTVTLPSDSKLIEIGDRAFGNCESLASITLPRVVSTIGCYAFAGCSALKEITIPRDVRTIQRGAFVGCSGITSFTIPDTVKKVEDALFSGCKALTRVSLPGHITSIGSSMFNECSSLTEITIPESVESIEGYAFAACESLPQLTIPESVKSIGAWAFAGCTSLTELTIPKSVQSIGAWAFSLCERLTALTIPEGVQSIEDKTFSLCAGLTEITIPKSVKSIGDFAFFGCDSLKHILYEGTVQEWGNIRLAPMLGLNFEVPVFCTNGMRKIGTRI